jgi:polysaccharide deacetylase family protein (PEP-CTERM system associated)
MITNALTIDFEDWFCAGNLSSLIKFEDWEKHELRIVDNTLRILELLDKYNLKATFFVLGWIAERVPDLVKLIDSNNHEIACHGYSHTSLKNMSMNQFDADLKKALKIKKDIIQKDILGYRSPSFSITPKTIWAFDVLINNGIKYDSSVFPISLHPDYGFPGMPTAIYNPQKALTEFPLNAVNLLGLMVPFGGGGYFRLYPYFVSIQMMKFYNNRGKPFMFYLHPWEIDIEQPRVNIPSLKKIRHYYNIKNTFFRFEKLLNQFKFSTVRHIIENRFTS